MIDVDTLAMSLLGSAPVVALNWKATVRVVPRYPPIERLEQVDPELQASVIAELATISPELIGDLRLLPLGPLPTGQGASRIIASYTFSQPGRFNGSASANFYGADSLRTAIAETVYHSLRALRYGNAPPQTLPSRLALHVGVQSNDVVDVRQTSYPEIYDSDRYD